MTQFQLIVRHGDIVLGVHLKAANEAAAREMALSATWGGIEKWQDAFETNEIVSITPVGDFSYVVLCDSELVSGH